MTTIRIAIVTLPLLVASSPAFADSGEKKRGASESQTPIEEPKAEVPPVPEPPKVAPAPPPAEPPPVVGTTQTTAAYAAETREPKVEEPKFAGVADRVSIEPLVGAGTNDFNFGVGGRIGYTFEVPVYLGATFMWHGGETDSFTTVSSFTETKKNFYYPGLEVGYDIGVGRRGNFVLRPYAGAAILLERERVTVNNVPFTNTSDVFMVYPGLTAHYRFGDTPAYVGADTRLLIPVENTGLSYQGFLLAGLSL